MDQMDYLFKKDMLHTHYLSQQAGWDHDHCESCFDDFLEMFQWEPHNFEQSGKKSFTNRSKEPALLSIG